MKKSSGNLKLKANRKINVIMLLVFFISSLTTSIHAQGIEFVYDLDEAIAKAKLENKLVFVDFYTSWCGPCKMLDNNVFPVKKVGDFFNNNFINCKVQCDDDGVGEELGKKYNINAYPTLMYLDGDGEMVHIAVGYFLPDALIESGKTALNPELNLNSILTEWKSGNRDKEFVNLYFEELKKNYRSQDASLDFVDYFNKLNVEGKTSENTFDLFKVVGIAPYSSTFEYLENNYDIYVENIGKDKVDEFIADSYLRYLQNISRNASVDEYNNAMKQFENKNYSYYDEYKAFNDVFMASDDIDEYQRLGTEFLSEYGHKNDAYTIRLTSLLGNLTGRPNQGIAGVVWMENLLDRNDDPRYLNTYFYILWRNFMFDKAIETGEQMRSIAIKNGESTTSIDKNIDDVHKMKEKYKERD